MKAAAAGRRPPIVITEQEAAELRERGILRAGRDWYCTRCQAWLSQPALHARWHDSRDIL